MFDLDFVVDREGRKDNDDDDNEVLSLVGEKGRVPTEAKLRLLALEAFRQVRLDEFLAQAPLAYLD